MFGIFAATCRPLRVASVASFQLGLRIELVLSEFFSSHALILSGWVSAWSLYDRVLFR